MIVVELGLCAGPLRGLGENRSIPITCAKGAVRPRRAPFCQFIEDLGDGHATAGLAKFRYVEIQASLASLDFHVAEFA